MEWVIGIAVLFILARAQRQNAAGAGGTVLQFPTGAVIPRNMPSNPPGQTGTIALGPPEVVTPAFLHNPDTLPGAWPGLGQPAPIVATGTPQQVAMLPVATAAPSNALPQNSTPLNYRLGSGNIMIGGL